MWLQEYYSRSVANPSPKGFRLDHVNCEGGNMYLLWWIIVGVVAGWATGKIMKGGGYGFWLDLVLGIVGAMVGGFIARHLGLAASGGIIYTILVAIGGSVLVVFIFRLLTRGRG